MSDKYSIVRNHNYTISVSDRNGKTIIFRDITGVDLEFLEKHLDSKEGLDSEGVLGILDLLCESNIPFMKLTPRVLKELFEIVAKEILCNYVPKMKWLEICYALQNNSFVALGFFESQPMTKVMAMVQVHQNAIEEMKKSNK